ncbi:hypothetical protein SDC9_177115 [bioreactor metagenome]|uniref:Uncharacterized protein n=1 Tax=bioreactor metagenome TaxID=1076179 RepID=A0A645GUJ7_9ZZZZ
MNESFRRRKFRFARVFGNVKQRVIIDMVNFRPDHFADEQVIERAGIDAHGRIADQPDARSAERGFRHGCGAEVENAVRGLADVAENGQKPVARPCHRSAEHGERNIGAGTVQPPVSLEHRHAPKTERKMLDFPQKRHGRCAFDPAS